MKAQEELIRQMKENMELVIDSIKFTMEQRKVSGELNEWDKGYDQGRLEANKYYLRMINKFIRRHEV